MKTHQAIGKLLRRALKKQGKTVNWFCKEMNLSGKQAAEIWKGNVFLERFCKACEVLGIPFNYFD